MKAAALRRIPLEAWLFGLVLAVNLYAALVPANSLMNWFSSDDAFYYFKTAQNISEGKGITFDGMGRASGFHPLWMILCVPIFALARYDLLLPLRLVVLVSGVLSAGTAVLLYRLARRVLSVEAAGLGALFFALSPYVHTRVVEMGLESGLSGFFIVLLFSRAAAGAGQPDPQDPSGRRRAAVQMLLSGLVGALAILARLDNVFLVLAAGAWLVVRPLRMRVLLALDLALILLGVFWSYFSRVGFGPDAVTLAASAYWMAAAAVGLRLGLNLLLGLYAPPAQRRSGALALALRVLGAASLGSLLLAGVMTALMKAGVFAGFPRLALVYEAGFALAALSVTRAGAFLLAPARPDEARFRWRPALERAIPFAIPIAVFLGAYMALSLGYFGTPMPVSGQLKRWWGTLPNPIYGRPAESLGGLLGPSERSRPWGLLEDLTGWPGMMPDAVRTFGYLALGGALFAAQPRRSLTALRELGLLPLFTGGFILLISYTGTGYLHMRPWYWTAQMLAITLMLAILAEAAFEILNKWKMRLRPGLKPGRLLALTLGGLVIISGGADLVRRIAPVVPADQSQAYLREPRLLEEITVPDAIVGMTGGGVMAYFTRERVIVNLDGLMNTVEYFHLLQVGQAGSYLDRIGLEYVFGVPEVLDSDPYFQFQERLEPIHNYNGTVLYRWAHK